MLITNKRYKFTSRIKLILLFLICVQVAQAYAKPSGAIISSIRAPSLTANSYILIDYNSDELLVSKDIDKVVEPASLTKMMTMYVVDKEIKNGNLRLEDMVLVSKKAWKVEGSRMFLEVGSKVSVNDIINGIIVSSANDGSIAIAEHIAGSEDSFTDIMNSYASILGMKNTNFVNATGLPDENHYTTSRDMAALAKAIIRDFPESYAIYSQKSYTHLGIKQFNRNRLLWRNSNVDGIKTGHTESAGYCLVASAEKNDMRLISVVVGVKSDEVRTLESNKLLTWGFRFFKTHKIYGKDQVFKSLPIWMGKTKALPVGLAEDLYITVRKGAYSDLKASIVTEDAVIKAPRKQGEVVGSFKVNYKNEIVAEKPLIALKTIESGNIFSRTSDYINLTFKSLISKFN